MKRLTRDYDWARIFIELSLRALRRVHYDYGPWGVGRPWIMRKSQTHRINAGRAIELADEPSVCAAITQEVIASAAVAGRWIGANGKEEERYFQIEREWKYLAPEQERSKVDMCLRKFLRKDKSEELSLVDKPSFIEAKRARVWTVRSFGDNDIRPAATDQVRQVQSDIGKLRDELRFRKSIEDPIHCHVLVWGIYDVTTNLRRDHPLTFFRRVRDNQVELHQLRWLPIAWPHPPHRRLSSGSRNISPPKIERWLWIALAEVFALNNG